VGGGKTRGRIHCLFAPKWDAQLAIAETWMIIRRSGESCAQGILPRDKVEI